MSKRILITGGAGCLGSNLIEHFFPKDFEICVIDNFATGKREVVPEQRRLKLVEGSVVDKTLVEKTFAHFKPDYVIHSAAAYKEPNDWLEDSETNVLGSINIVHASMAHGVKRLINFQTALCYGRPNQIPIPINHPTSPFTSYGISKTAGEAYLIHSDVPTISLRLANICGPRLAIGPIPTFYKRLKAEQNCFCSDTVRDFLDMSDFLNLIDFAIMDDSPTGVFNVSTGVGHSIYDVYKSVSCYLGIDAPDVPLVPVGDDDVPEVVLDPSETERVFDWKSNVDFQDTISNQLKWYDQYGINDIFSHLAAPKKTSGTL